MVTKELIKTEIDKVQDEYLEALYRIVLALRITLSPSEPIPSWPVFIQKTYGCFADDPIERGNQGVSEIRDAIA